MTHDVSGSLGSPTQARGFWEPGLPNPGSRFLGAWAPQLRLEGAGSLGAPTQARGRWENPLTRTVGALPSLGGWEPQPNLEGPGHPNPAAKTLLTSAAGCVHFSEAGGVPRFEGPPRIPLSSATAERTQPGV